MGGVGQVSPSRCRFVGSRGRGFVGVVVFAGAGKDVVSGGRRRREDRIVRMRGCRRFIF